MTPKEKASHLYNHFISALGYFGMMDVFFTQRKEAKNCALIAVKHIIDVINRLPIDAEVGINADYCEYWEEVKREIEEL